MTTTTSGFDNITTFDQFKELVGERGEGIVIDGLMNNISRDLITNLISCFKTGKLNAAWLALCAHKYVSSHGLVDSIREACDCYKEALERAKIDKSDSIYCVIRNMESETAWAGVSLERNRRKRIRIYDRRKNWIAYPGKIPSAELFSLGNFLLYMVAQVFTKDDTAGMQPTQLIAIKFPLMKFTETVIPWFREKTQGKMK